VGDTAQTAGVDPPSFALIGLFRSSLVLLGLLFLFLLGQLFLGDACGSLLLELLVLGLDLFDAVGGVASPAGAA